MARFHFWGFIVNEAGEPIENANVTIKLAGTDVQACLYFDEYGNYNTCLDNTSSDNGYQLKTLDNGYYEFWVGDITETHGYRYDQKFKIEWDRPGVAYGMIDNVNIVPMAIPTYPVLLTDCASAGPDSSEMNKLISNELACKWETHTTTIIENDTVHGLEFVDVIQFDTRPNKLISNEHGWRWHHHTDSTVSSYHPSAGPPHDIEPLDVLSSDTKRNKVVSNKDIHDLYVLMLKSFEIRIDTTDWINSGSGSLWYYDINHNLDILYPHVTSYDDTTHEIEKLSTVRVINSNTIKIIMNSEVMGVQPSTSLWVRISG